MYLLFYCYGIFFLPTFYSNLYVNCLSVAQTGFKTMTKVICRMQYDEYHMTLQTIFGQGTIK